MTKKLIAVICLIAFLTLAPVSAAAEQDAKVVQAFSHGGALYAYMNISGDVDNSLAVEAQINNERFAQARHLGSVEKLQIPVYYMFLVDISGSMPLYRGSIETFIEAFMDEAGSSASFLLATFAKEFNSIGGFTSDADEIKANLAGLEYNAQHTGLYAGIADAVDYFSEMERASGELYQIIVITDGVEDDKEGITFPEIESKISKSTVTVHTFGLSNPGASKSDKEVTEQVLKELGAYARVSSGLHNAFGYDSKTEADIAKEISDYVKNLHAVEFKLASFKSNGGEYPVVLYFKSGSELSFKLEMSVKIPQTESAVLPTSQQTINMPTATPAAMGEPAQGDALDEPAAAQDAGEEAAVGMVAAFLETYKLPLTVGGSVVLLLLAGGTVLIIKNKKRKSKDSQKRSRIFIKLEVINGRHRGGSGELYLEDALIIGRSKSCDIVFRDADVSDKNSRVFIRDTIIYIEDLNSKNGTAISDMRIHAPNRLRSGDIISIGDVRFSLKF